MRSAKQAKEEPQKKFEFTTGALRHLRPTPGAQRWAYYYDGLTRGLAIGVSPTGAKSFLLYRWFKGRPVRITLGIFDPSLPDTRELPDGAKPLELLGHKPSLNLRMARKLAVAAAAQMDVGTNPAVEATAERRKGLTLGELFQLYVAYLRKKGKKRVPEVIWEWERYLGQLPNEPRKRHGAKRSKAPGAVNWEHRLVTDIRYEEVSRLWLALGEKVGHTTANAVVKRLRAIFSFGKKQRHFRGENPAEGHDKFQLVSRERFLQRDELKKFFNALDAMPRDFADFTRIALFSGARRGNVLAMRWDDLDLDGARWTISGELLKNGEPLTIPLVNEVVEILKARAENATTEWVFPGDSNGHMGPPRKRWSQLLKASGVSGLWIHDLRRSAGSWMSGTGAASPVVMRALGHKSAAASLIYQRISEDPVRASMERAVEAMKQAAKGEGPKVVQMPAKRAKRSPARSAKGGR